MTRTSLAGSGVLLVCLGCAHASPPRDAVMRPPALSERSRVDSVLFAEMSAAVVAGRIHADASRVPSGSALYQQVERLAAAQDTAARRRNRAP